MPIIIFARFFVTTPSVYLVSTTTVFLVATARGGSTPLFYGASFYLFYVISFPTCNLACTLGAEIWVEALPSQV